MYHLVCQSCLTLCDPMDCSPLGSPVHGILQARILEWVTISSSSLTQESNPHLLCLLHCSWILYCWTTREGPCIRELGAINYTWIQERILNKRIARSPQKRSSSEFSNLFFRSQGHNLLRMACI